MSPAQADILRAIHTTIAETGVSPSYREIARLARRPLGNVHENVQALVADGFLRRPPGRRRRGIEVIRLPVAWGDVCPHCGAKRAA